MGWLKRKWSVGEASGTQRRGRLEEQERDMWGTSVIHHQPIFFLLFRHNIDSVKSLLAYPMENHYFYGMMDLFLFRTISFIYG